MADYEFLAIERHGAVTTLTLNRPQRRNALTHRMMLELEDAFVGIGQDAQCRVLVLRGAGGHFCAGGDLDAMANLPPLPPSGTDPLVPAYRQFGNALLALDGLPQATVAVVEGSAVGAGFGMACCSDVVILHASARFGIPEPKVGFIPSQIIPFLVRRMGEGPVRDLAVTGRVIDAAEANRLGVGRYLCAGAAEVETTLQGLLDDILKLEPKALAVAKRLVMSCATQEDRVVMDEAAQSLVGLLRQPEAVEGIRHFMAKTTPSWAKR
ncbi:enoyl-CoA hydratase/isomerase family protein [uncultured Reyranella sp.]|uniref:enoyl-CoA hydratase/isomerase family protein n=1 Tax=uncultured Reyranella sp. TaxID=735512 RepID=UPI00259C9F2B|nr:enoyl-CoA hydratase/isomerase family protein [uncultured Reyranella sp.]